LNAPGRRAGRAESRSRSLSLVHARRWRSQVLDGGAVADHDVQCPRRRLAIAVGIADRFDGRGLAVRAIAILVDRRLIELDLERGPDPILRHCGWIGTALVIDDTSRRFATAATHSILGTRVALRERSVLRVVPLQPLADDVERQRRLR